MGREINERRQTLRHENSYNMLALNDEEIAKQLTKSHFAVFKKIKVSELFDVAWTRANAGKLFFLLLFFNFLLF